MKVVRFEVSTEVLQQVLHLPSSAEIVGAEWVGGSSSVRLSVEDQMLPESDSPRDADPTITHVMEEYRWDWGVE